MNIALVSLNVSYIHKNLALRWLYVTKPAHLDAKIYEYTTKQVDLCAAKLIEDKPDVLGLSTYIFNVEATKELITKVKAGLPNLRIYLGGPEVTANPDPLWDYPIDGILMGEGEFSFWKAVEGQYTPGLQTFKGASSSVLRTDLLELERLESPYFLSFDQEDMDKRYLYAETSRGCPYGCAYCMASLDRNVRLFSESYMDSFFDQLKDTQVKQVKFLDRTFNVDPKRALRLGKQCLSMPELMQFHVELVGDTLHPSLIEFFKTEAVKRFRMEIGVQSFQKKTLEAVGRPCDLAKLSTVIRDFALVGSHQHTDLIAGLPFETLDLFKESYRKLIHLEPFEIQVGILKLLHGTILHGLREIYGYQAEAIAPYQITQSKWMNKVDIEAVEAVALATEKCYNSGRLKKELDLWFKSNVEPFDVLFVIGKALMKLGHPYQIKEFYLNIYDAIKNIHPNPRSFVEEAYYRQNRTRPSQLFEMEVDLEVCKRLSQSDERIHHAILMKQNNSIKAVLYVHHAQIWFDCTEEGEIINEVTLSYTKS
ncbi:MAG TPA: hypothetical protein DIC19_01990 [Erysipelotrichaceae bacterium]|nr:hypothetical protein [Erysipelotrichaceae bacterium]